MSDSTIINAVRRRTRDYGLTIHDKAESGFMVFLYVVSFMWIWNRRFLDGYWTTIAGKCWAPMPIEPHDWPVIAHEGDHAERSARVGNVKFSILYLFPQCLGAFALLALLAIPLSSWWLLALVFLVALLPLPAPWRAEYERSAYTVSAAMLVLRGDADLGDERWVTFFAAKFGLPYYMPIWSNQRRRAMARRIIDDAAKALSGKGDAYLLDMIATVRAAKVKA